MIALWHGRQPLGRAFWEYAIAYGAALNILAAFATLAVLAGDWPPGLAIAVHLVPVPYFLAAAVGVWRSATAYAGSPRWAHAAKAAVAIWTVVMVLA